MEKYINYVKIKYMKEIIDKIIKEGFDCYIVGGYVRDYLLGYNSKDIDICTNAKVEDIIKIFGERGQANRNYFSYHIKDGEYSYDITSFRKELEYKKNKPVKLEYAKDLKTDLLRRDFTINTFAIDSNGKLLDILNAKKDLDDKIIKVVGNTTEKLLEDKTRIIRAIRFSCTLDFELDSEIKEFLKSEGKVINQIPKEYIRKELDKIFESNHYDKFFNLVKEFDIGKYLNISFNEIHASYDKYGIWAQIETTLPFSNNEKVVISYISNIIKKGSINTGELLVYSDIITKNASYILGLDKMVNSFEEINKLHSVIEMDIKPQEIAKYINIKYVKKVYKHIEKEIMNGNLPNDNEKIKEYLKELNIKDILKETNNYE